VKEITLLQECTPFSSGREKLASCTRMLDAGVVPPIA